MKTTVIPAALLAAALGLGSAQAQQFTRPFLSTASGAESTTFQDVTFTNNGLQGAGRLAASSRDALGDTFGSFSSFKIDLRTWRLNSDGSYSGKLLALGDRGYNDPATNFFSDYAGRLNILSFSFTPYTSTTALTASTSSQSQVKLTSEGSIVFSDFSGKTTTGLDPAAGTLSVAGQPLLPGINGKISIDAEGLALLPDGSFYVSDEYGPYIYKFDKNGKLQGVVAPPKALLPVTNGQQNFNSTAIPTTGRRNNQGLEGVDVTPDGSKLVTLLQSATIQDSNEVNQASRLNTRLLIYDITKTATPANPEQHYVLELPTFRNNGNGSAVDRTAAQSELLALNDKQFLVLSRDGNGLGTPSTNPIVFKNILLVDISGATNLAGTSYETSTTPVSPNGVRLASITPVKTATFVNILNTTQLTRFGLNTDNPKANSLTISEKWEALSLAPVLEESAPQDQFLFVGNDNDLLTKNGIMQGKTYNAGLENDNLVLVYRLTLPTYVDPQHFQAMSLVSPAIASVTGRTALDLGRFASRDVASRLFALRSAPRPGVITSSVAGATMQMGKNPVIPEPVVDNGRRFDAYVVGDYANTQQDANDNSIELDSDLWAATGGLDYRITPNLTLGAAIGRVHTKADLFGDGGDDLQTRGTTASAYASGVFGGFYADLAYTYGDQDFNRIRRPAAYGLTATGKTNATTHTTDLNLGYNLKFGNLVLGPTLRASYVKAEIDGYTETGASGGNVTYGDQSLESLVIAPGLQISTVIPICPEWRLAGQFRAAYEFETEDSEQTIGLKLASAQSSLASISRTLPSAAQDRLRLGATAEIQGANGWSFGLSYDALIGENDDITHSVAATIRASF